MQSKLYDVIMKGEIMDGSELEKLPPVMKTLVTAPKRTDQWSVIWDATVTVSLKKLGETLALMGFPDGWVTQDANQILWAKAND